ncbi:MAG: hypothetical protein B7Y25_03230 [Alphaproteobacteria bacterium 16-39-46]|nr:MAG: hypothetical protein B7Y25_03230 [Alphaproteobacteria bacterium 16-39-46]OZA43809.1 MAG: hypothetical protein B7X84_02165 [Alphaproteobacteria bacterium 17-39-52]HQS83721.1 hypothetical protein [Alphaproteobacteria bacterium]HQS93476.1 hypothetical protein [Alphaproteobacteria bacterium]
MGGLPHHDLMNKDHPLDDKALKKALTVLDVMNFKDEEREAYEGRLKWLRIEANTLKKYKADGKIEEKIEISRNMLQEGISVKVISKVTMFDENEILQLSK